MHISIHSFRTIFHNIQEELHENAIKFPSANNDIATVHVDQKTARESYVASLKSEPTRRLYTVNPDDRSPQRRGRSPTRHSERRTFRRQMIALIDLDPRMDNPRMEAGENLHPLPLRDDRHVTYIGTSLKPDDRKAISTTLMKNADLFAWTAADMPDVDLKVITHKLSLYKEVKPIAQKKRKLGEERRTAARAEADKLLQAGFIRKAHYTTWLANVVMVKKTNGKWRMCVDYTDLNKACPKDSYPLPTIDRLVDGAAGHHILNFLDAYSGYNQIQMHPADRKKMAFMTDCDNFYYEVMPFGLKNAGATYQRLMDHVFHDMIGRNVEVYVDDIVVKSDSGKQHIADLKEVFQALRQHRMRLNPDKCAFGVEGEKFLGFMLTHRGIEANPEKCKAISEMRSPNSIKEIQRLIGRLTALSRFVPKLAEKMRPMVQLLKKASRFEWSTECEEIFLQLKTFLSSPPVIQKPDAREPIIVYLAVSNEAVSSVLV